MIRGVEEENIGSSGKGQGSRIKQGQVAKGKGQGKKTGFEDSRGQVSFT